VRETTDVPEKSAVPNSMTDAANRCYHLLFEQSPVASLLASREGLILEFNQRAAELLALDVNHQPQPDLFSFFSPEDRSLLHSQLQMTFSEHLQRSASLRLLLAAGMESSVRLISAPVASQPDICQVTLLDLGEQPRNLKLLSQLAYYDQLTGLPNRLLFSDRLRWAIRDARRQKERLAVMLIDLDDFKHVNDTLGHEAGDRLLQIITGRMTSSLRESDTLSRRGGDEFTALIQHVNDRQDAASAANRLLEAIGKPSELQGREIISTASIGICLYPDDGDTADSLIQNADIAMYQSKAGGRNRLSFFNESMRIEATQHSVMEIRLRQALQAEELEVHYQPLIDVSSLRIIGLEALMRWRSGPDGLMTAGQFLPLAETLGLLGLFSDWAMLQACRQMKDWLDRGVLSSSSPVRLAVNLYRGQLNQDNLAARIQEILAESGLPPAALAIEATEDMLQQNDPKQLVNLQHIRKLGIALHLDDFSQGFGSLQKMNIIPFEYLKISQNHTAVFLENRRGEALLDALLNLAHTLGLKVVAEGVENRDEYVWLKEHACDGIQGYYFSRPLPAVEMEMLLQLPRPL